MGASLFRGGSSDPSSVAFRLRDDMSVNDEVEDDNEGGWCLSGDEWRRGRRDILPMGNSNQHQPAKDAQFAADAFPPHARLATSGDRV